MQELRRVAALEGPDNGAVCAGGLPLAHRDDFRTSPLGEELDDIETVEGEDIKSCRFQHVVNRSDVVVERSESRLVDDPTRGFGSSMDPERFELCEETVVREI